MMLLTDRFDDRSMLLMRSLTDAGYQPDTVSISCDGFLPPDVISPYAYYAGYDKKDRKGEPLYFDRLKVPDKWEIRASQTGGAVFDFETKRAKIFFIKPKEKRFVHIVDWLDKTGKVRTSDHYDRFGYRFAQTVLNKDEKPLLRSYYDLNGKEVITEHFMTGHIVLRKGKQEYVFPDRAHFVLHFLKERGFDLSRVCYNSLSVSFAVSLLLEQTEQSQGGDILFWQEDIRDSIPQNMRLILSKKTKRTSRIFVQYRDAFEKLTRLGASERIVRPLGFVHRLLRENKGRPHALIMTNTDQVEQLLYLAQALPGMTFHVGAITEMSAKLEACGQLENIFLYPAIRQKKADELFRKCDYYFDINHANEIFDTLQRAFSEDQLIFAFRETIHHPALVFPGHVFFVDEKKKMVDCVRRIMRDNASLKSALKKQKEHAMAETRERYREMIGEAPVS